MVPVVPVVPVVPLVPSVTVVQVVPVVLIGAVVPPGKAKSGTINTYQAFARVGMPLFVAYYRRAYPRFLRVKQLIDLILHV